MSQFGPIVIIEDDEDDIYLFRSVVKELEVNNKIIWFSTTDEAYQYLADTEEYVFLIFCDLVLSNGSGLDFKKSIEKNAVLRNKCIPFMFFSTTVHQKHVNEAFNDMIVQGFFQKPSDYSEMKKMLATIFDYWKMSRHPNSTDTV